MGSEANSGPNSPCTTVTFHEDKAAGYKNAGIYTSTSPRIHGSSLNDAQSSLL